MKTTALILTSALLVVLSGCLIPNENPFYLDDQIVSKPEIVGDWYQLQGPMDTSLYETYSVAENEDSDGYILTYTDMGKQTGTFTLQFAEFDDILIADIIPIELPEVDISTSASSLWALRGHGCFVIKEVTEHQITVRCMWSNEWDEILADYDKEEIPVDENNSLLNYKVPTADFQAIIKENIDNDELWIEMTLVDELPESGHN
jgi:hypothetical protein